MKKLGKTLKFFMLSAGWIIYPTGALIHRVWYLFQKDFGSADIELFKAAKSILHPHHLLLHLHLHRCRHLQAGHRSRPASAQAVLE